ncbi:uncharacterized protein LOC131660372 [Vicia villosa]|uniref:uncharacterized protein LOC131660372 n=1 Tax=Vicia villosa TaxID=3911 RepID=UPI00273BCE73|nr:uncharacterized protein LOC131660372 [Vicia villosa]
MAPPKPNNPSAREIVEEAVNTTVQTSQLHINNALQETQQQLDERFHKSTMDFQQHIGQLHTRLENETQAANSRYDSIMSILTKLREQPTIPLSTQHLSPNILGSSGLSQNLFSTPMTPHSITFAPSIVHSTAIPFIPSVHTYSDVVPNTAAQPPPPPNPYSSSPSAFIPIPSYPFQAQQMPNIPPLPLLRTPKLELPPFDGCYSRAQGLCFNCDEKFIPGHKCAAANRFLLLLADDEVTTFPVEDEEIIQAANAVDTNDTYFQLSTQALTGQFSPQTLKFQGLIGGHLVMDLVDTGSTHNILQHILGHHLNLPTTQILQFLVMVGNGSHLQCEGICHSVKLNLQEKPFSLPFYLLPIEGANVVLGMAWLRTLGPIQADFSIPSITFNHKDSKITLTGDPSALSTLTTFHQLRQLLHTNSVISFHLLTFQPTEIHQQPPPLQHQTEPIDPNILKLIHKYPSVFQQKPNCPPPRTHDHRIPLLPNTPPINVKPYRYPHSQKEAMIVLIQEMLQDGLIVPSNSPFSSPVLIVKKRWKLALLCRLSCAKRSNNQRSFPHPNHR